LNVLQSKFSLNTSILNLYELHGIFLFCRTKYQKNVEASHNKGLKAVPNSIRSENYTITVEVEEEKYELNLCISKYVWKGLLSWGLTVTCRMVQVSFLWKEVPTQICKWSDVWESLLGPLSQPYEVTIFAFISNILLCNLLLMLTQTAWVIRFSQYYFICWSRLAREAGLEYVDIQNLTEFYDDNRCSHLIGCLMLLTWNHFINNAS
jgi:hypothetical protein